MKNVFKIIDPRSCGTSVIRAFAGGALLFLLGFLALQFSSAIFHDENSAFSAQNAISDVSSPFTSETDNLPPSSEGRVWSSCRSEFTALMRLNTRPDQPQTQLRKLRLTLLTLLLALSLQHAVSPVRFARVIEQRVAQQELLRAVLPVRAGPCLA